VPPEETDAHKDGCLAAVEAGWAILQKGGSALDAVEAAVRVLEDNPTFNAGYGSELNAAGEVETDAAIMDGRALDAGGVGALQGVRHPISVARQLLAEEPVLLVAHGARRFAEARALELCDPAQLVTEKQRRKWESKSCQEKGHDTVGCVAMDSQGNLAAGTSTGGTNSNVPGRIGDSPLIGSGLYADNHFGACSMTGDGEAIARVVLAKTTIDLLRDERHPDDAAHESMQILQTRVNGEAGCIVIDRLGRIGWAHNAPNLPCAYRTNEMNKAEVWVHKDEVKDF
jgi:beta-aspartyl-peptidase (threonine type)